MHRTVTKRLFDNRASVRGLCGTLLPTHLEAAVETVASFGKPAPISPETRQAKAEEAPISIGTMIKTVTEKTVTG